MSGRSIYLNIRHKFSKFLNPALCMTCGIPTRNTHFICPDCLDSLTLVVNPCSSCGLPNAATGNICASCQLHPLRWQNMIAPLSYQGHVRKIIHDLKFNEQLHYANALLTHIHPFYLNQQVDTLLPVPLHKNRLLQRGFNQSEEIAKILSNFLSIPVDRNSLTRVKPTEAQSGLSLPKRQQNILQAFNYKPVRQYHSVAIVDDIITTGSTMSEICKTLKKSGIKHIQVWSLARALKHD